MQIFNIIAGGCSIFSLLISLFVANKVIKINNTLKMDESTNVGRQFIFGKGNKTAGRDIK